MFIQANSRVPGRRPLWPNLGKAVIDQRRPIPANHICGRIGFVTTNVLMRTPQSEECSSREIVLHAVSWREASSLRQRGTFVQTRPRRSRLLSSVRKVMEALLMLLS